MKIVPIDKRFVFVIGGSINNDPLAPSTKGDHPFSIYLFDLHLGAMIEQRPMLSYRQHCATAVYNRKHLLMLGGEANGTWLTGGESFNFVERT